MTNQQIGTAFKTLSIQQILEDEELKNIFLRLYYNYKQLQELNINRGKDGTKKLILG